MVESDVGMCDVGKVKPDLASWLPSVVLTLIILSSGQPSLCAAIPTFLFTIPLPWPPYLCPTLGFHPVP